MLSLWLTFLSINQQAFCPLPQSALETIAAINAAATSQDTAEIRKRLASDFTWTFGPVADAERRAWRPTAEDLNALRNVTAQQCGYIEERIIQCPENAGLSTRAGFRETVEGTWQFAYFVTGD